MNSLQQVAFVLDGLHLEVSQQCVDWSRFSVCDGHQRIHLGAESFTHVVSRLGCFDPADRAQTTIFFVKPTETHTSRSIRCHHQTFNLTIWDCEGGLLLQLF